MMGMVILLSNWMITQNTDANELYHHGIKGQKWGIRRYQNPDGTMTEEGLIRYGRSNRALTRGLNAANRQTFQAQNRLLNSAARYNRIKNKNPEKAKEEHRNLEEHAEAVKRGQRATQDILNSAVNKNKLVRMTDDRLTVELKNVPSVVQNFALDYVVYGQGKTGDRIRFKVKDSPTEGEFLRVTTPTSVEERANGSDPFKTTTIYGKHDDDRCYKNGGR